MKNTLIPFVFTCFLFLQGVWTISPCKPGYVEVENCNKLAISPEGGNCYWAEDYGSCHVLGNNEAECAENCYQCLTCFYNYGCCYAGNPANYPNCFQFCVANMRR